MALLPSFFLSQFLTDAGAVAASYLLYTYDSGTTTPKATYTTQLGNVENANPIVLDSAGRCSLWLGSGEYTFTLKTPAGVTVKTWDDVAGVPVAVTGDYLPLAGGTMTGAIVLPGNATTNLQAVPKQQIDTLIAAAVATLTTSIDTAETSAAPIGTVAMFAGSTAPTNWLQMNGAAVSRTTYADLFAVIGTTYGVGNGSTTFNIPEARGEFFRSLDSSRGVDAGRALGSAQAAAIETHSHLNGVADMRETAFVYGGETTGIPGESTAIFDSDAGSATHQGNTSTTGGTETRPRNVAFMGIIKAL
jgi:microcystin-dependent protein